MPSYHNAPSGGSSSRQQQPAADVIQENQRDKIPNESQREPSRGAGDWFKAQRDKPLWEYINEAYTYNALRREDAIPWRTSLFFFAWMIRGHKDMAKHLEKPKEAWKVIDARVAEWTAHKRRIQSPPPYGFNGDPWFDWFCIDKDEAKAEFIDVWQKSRYMPGHDPIEQAIDANRRKRIRLHDALREVRPICEKGENSEKDYEFFIGVAGHLQVIAGSRPILLPCNKIADALGVSAMTISRYRQWAVKDDFLKMVKAHQFRSRGGSEATEFQFNVARCTILEEKSQTGTRERYFQMSEYN